MWRQARQAQHCLQPSTAPAIAAHRPATGLTGSGWQTAGRSPGVNLWRGGRGEVKVEKGHFGCYFEAILRLSL